MPHRFSLILCLVLAACGGRGGSARSGRLGAGLGVDHPRVGSRGPNFAAQDPSGPWIPLDGLKERPVALLFFRTGAASAAELVSDFGRFRNDPSFAPTVFLGIDADSIERIKQFVKTRGATLPILQDPGTIARSYGVGELPAVVLLDSDHVVRFQLDGYLGRDYRPRLDATVAALHDLPHIPKQAEKSLEVAYSENPRAPLFEARDLEGRRVDLAALKGRVVVLNFFDQECPHCRKDLPLLVPVLREFRARGIAAFGITSRDLGGGLRRYLKDHGIDYPVIVDPGRAIFARYESTRTPDTVFIDKDGFVRFREQGERPDRTDLTRLQLRLLLGKEDPAILAARLPKDRFAGDGVCRACHLREYRDWLLTPHSIAWDSLQKGEKWRDRECVACHVTGPGLPGGFVNAEATSQMTNVQCEVCHGPGGGHPEQAHLDAQSIARVCTGCHTGKFVLNFDRDEALGLVAHRDHPDMEKLFRYSGLQRQRLEEINKRRLEKFKSGVAYVGADACRDCHRPEYDQWSRTPHAGAFATLLQAGRGRDTTCVPCHTTGLGHNGGLGQERPSQPAMTNVQCEVCHGPGEDHVKAPRELKKETIYGITNQCSFCIIQGVCATCHDQANDPRFDIDRALPLVRHAAAAP